MKKTTFILILILFSFPVFGQIDTVNADKTIDSLIELSKTATVQGDLDGAKGYNLQAENIAVENFGEESFQYGKVCLDKGRSMLMVRNYDGAEKWLIKSKEINEKISGEENPNYALCLNLLGALYLGQGEYEKGREVALKAKTIFEFMYGRGDARYLQSLVFLGMLNFRTGDYFSAEKDFLDVIFYTKDREDFNSKAAFISASSTLALVYENMNSYEKAEKWYLETLTITENLAGKKNINYADVLGNLGGCYFKTGKFEEAAPIFIESYEINKKILGENGVDLAYNLNNLGMLNYELGRLDSAALYLSKAENILIENDAEEGYIYAIVLQSLAKLNLKKENLDAAEIYLNKAKCIYEKITGKYHHQYIDCLILQDELFVDRNNFDEALKNAQEINNINKQRAINASHHLSEFELSNFISEFSHEQGRFFSYSQLYGGDNGCIFDNALFYKGYLLERIGKAERLAQSDKRGSELYAKLKTLRRNMESEYEKPLAERMDIQQMEAEAEAVEKELIRTVAGFSDVTRQVKWEEVQSALTENEAVIEFVHFDYYSPKLTDSIFYAALILRLGMDEPEWVTLFEEKQLRELLLNDNQNIPQSINGLYSSELYDLVWEKVGPHLIGVEKIYYSPSGLLHRVNLPVIHVSENRRLMDKYSMYYVNSSRQLVTREKSENELSFSSTVIYGGLDYNMDTSNLTTELSLAYEGGNRGVFSLNDIYEENTPTRSRVWYHLPKTEEERKKIEVLFKGKGKNIVSLNGQSGTEEHFKSLAEENDSPEIIHLATHGFFFPDPEIEKEEKANYLRGGQSNFRFSDDPLFRSGLMLSGGNLAWKGGDVPEGREDGILSAYEISNLNLSNTKLIVLSACETGLGDIVGSEGVYGLQRAFKKAGVDYLIMTLWSIPDSEETVDFMETFYRYLLENKNVSKSFSMTQKEMRKKYIDPYYWAGFVLIE